MHGPYTDATLRLFDRILAEITCRAAGMTDETAFMLASRAVILTASTAGIPSTRYAEGAEPADRRDALFASMLDALLTGAEQLVAEGRVPQLPPTRTPRASRSGGTGARLLPPHPGGGNSRAI